MILDLSGFGFSFNEKGCSYLCKCKDCTYPFFAAKNSFRCYHCATDALLADQWEKRRKGKSGEEAPDSDLRATLIKGASIIKDLAEANARAESSESLVAELREKVERLTKALLRLQTGAAVALDALPEDQREGVVGNFLAAIHRECCAGLCASKGADECKEATP